MTNPVYPLSLFAFRSHRRCSFWWTRTMSIPSAAIYMIGYEYLVTALAPHLSPQTATATATAIAPSSSLSPPSTQSETKFSIPSSSATIPTSYLSTTPFVAGSLARTLSATVVSPMELFRTRLQALPQGEFWGLSASFLPSFLPSIHPSFLSSFFILSPLPGPHPTAHVRRGKEKAHYAANVIEMVTQ